MKNKFAVVTHAVLSDSKDIAGPAHNIITFLSKKESDYIFIRHSLFSEDKTLLTINKSGNLSEEKLDSVGNGGILNRLSEGFRTINLVRNSFDGKIIYIGIDPLNTLWGVILKRLGRVKTLIYFTVDYSPKRFGNPIFNSIYHLVDKFALLSSDKNWVVSERIYDLRLKQGKKEKDVVIVPNAPAFGDLKGLVKKNPNIFNLITVGTISKAHDFNLIIESLEEVVKKFPNVKLTIIGQGKGLDDLKKLIREKRLTKYVELLGSKTHEEVFKILSNQGIGIAIYTNDAPWSYYSDSMKARDFLALGLPVIISGNIGTSMEIRDRNAGIVVERNKKDISKSLCALLGNKKLYQELRENALRLAEERDIEKILEKALGKEIE